MSFARRAFAKPELFNAALYKQVQATWFGELLGSNLTSPSEAQQDRWFGTGTAEEKKIFDSICTETAKKALDAIGPDQYVLPTMKSIEVDERDARLIAAPFLEDITPKSAEDSTEAASNGLSIILLLDQMSRNIFRQDQKVIYTHYDRISRAIVKTMLAQQPRLDQHPLYRYSVIYRNWFYVPLMHSEALQDHELFSKMINEMIADLESKGDEAAVARVKSTMGFEDMHVNILKRFGRYPHRNEAVGRPSTEEELKYLQEGGETFGTKAGGAEE